MDHNKNEVDSAYTYDNLVQVADHIKNAVHLDAVPRIAIICGSGLASLGSQLKMKKSIKYEDIPTFMKSNVPGHLGQLSFGYISGKYVVCMEGRFHPYEYDMNTAMCAMPVRVMKILGADTLLLTNAAGGLNNKFCVGDLMIIKDHIFMPGLAGRSPLVGQHDDRFGRRFVSMNHAYDNELQLQASQVAEQLGVRLRQGVYAMIGGPHYETPAECRLLKLLGADVVGMSTAHEVIVARQADMRVFALSLISNISQLDSDNALEVTHTEVMEAGQLAANKVCAIFRGLLELLD